MALKESIRRRKRESRLDAAHKELSAELDALQETLGTALAEFDALLGESLGALPDWVDVDHGEIRGLYHVELEEQRLLMGARTAALVAARVEQFVVSSPLSPEAERPDEFADGEREAWQAELLVVDRLIHAVTHLGRSQAEVAQHELSIRFETHSAMVAEQREADPASQLDDLKSRLLAGKKGARVKQETDAEVLEGQRRRVEELEAAWAPLEQLAFVGADMSVDAAERLRELLTMTVHALVAEYPELAPHAGDYAPAEEPLRKRVFKAPPPLTVEDREGSPATRVEVDDAHRVTSPIIETQEMRTAEYSRDEPSDAVIDLVDETMDLEDLQSLKPVPLPPAGDAEPAEPDSSAQEARDDSEPASDGGDAGEVAEPESDEVQAADADEPEATEQGASDDGPSPREEGPDVELDEAAETAPIADAGTTLVRAAATMELAADITQEFREPAFREVEEWQRVHFNEILLALAPPGTYFIVMTGITTAYHLGRWSGNPFVEWPWAFPSFCAFALWALGMPALLRWRVAWNGVRPLPIRFSAEQDESFVEVDATGVSLDEHRFEFATTVGVLGRWEHGEKGWLLAIRDGERDAMFASTATSKRWRDVKAIAHPVEPTGAWRVSEETLLRIADRASVE